MQRPILWYVNALIMFSKLIGPLRTRSLSGVDLHQTSNADPEMHVGSRRTKQSGCVRAATGSAYGFHVDRCFPEYRDNQGSLSPKAVERRGVGGVVGLVHIYQFMTCFVTPESSMNFNLLFIEPENYAIICCCIFTSRDFQIIHFKALSLIFGGTNRHVNAR